MLFYMFDLRRTERFSCTRPVAIYAVAAERRRGLMTSSVKTFAKSAVLLAVAGLFTAESIVSKQMAERLGLPLQ